MVESTTIHTLPMTPTIHDWHIIFPDESYDIALECQGGLSRYLALGTAVDIVAHGEPLIDFFSSCNIGTDQIAFWK